MTIREIFVAATCYAGPTVCNQPEAVVGAALRQDVEETEVNAC
jgi:hypothetical protein